MSVEVESQDSIGCIACRASMQLVYDSIAEGVTKDLILLGLDYICAGFPVGSVEY